jgi:hypothetical protein
MKMGIKTAYKKDYLPHERKAQIAVSVAGDGEIKVFRLRDVVEEIEEKEDDRQMILAEAVKIKEDAAL